MNTKYLSPISLNVNITKFSINFKIIIINELINTTQPHTHISFYCVLLVRNNLLYDQLKLVVFMSESKIIMQWMMIRN